MKLQKSILINVKKKRKNYEGAKEGKREWQGKERVEERVSKCSKNKEGWAGGEVVSQGPNKVWEAHGLCLLRTLWPRPSLAQITARFILATDPLPLFYYHFQFHHRQLVTTPSTTTLLLATIKSITFFASYSTSYWTTHLVSLINFKSHNFDHSSLCQQTFVLDALKKYTRH